MEGGPEGPHPQWGADPNASGGLMEARYLGSSWQSLIFIIASTVIIVIEAVIVIIFQIKLVSPASTHTIASLPVQLKNVSIRECVCVGVCVCV